MMNWYVVGRVQFPRWIAVATITVEFPIAGGDTIGALRLNRLIMYQYAASANNRAAEVKQAALQTAHRPW